MPEKERYYFPHDYNARNDRKIAALVKEYKSSGYGIFWATCEMMHEEGGGLEFDEMTLTTISKDLNEDEELVRSVIQDCIERFKLFTKQDFLLQSSRVKQNLNTRQEKRNVKAEAGRLGGLRSGESRRKENITKQNEAVLQPASSIEAKERKGKEIKEIKEIPPSPPDTIISRMANVWRKINPSYQWYEEDYPALLDIAYKIAKAKGWEKNEVVNGKLDATEKSWETITHFIGGQDFYRKLDLKGINKQWTGLYQTMTASKNPIKKEETKQVKIVRD